MAIANYNCVGFAPARGKEFITSIADAVEARTPSSLEEVEYEDGQRDVFVTSDYERLIAWTEVSDTEFFVNGFLLQMGV